MKQIVKHAITFVFSAVYTSMLWIILCNIRLYGSEQLNGAEVIIIPITLIFSAATLFGLIGLCSEISKHWND